MLPKFSLQSVLDYRSSVVEALEIELGRLMAELLNAKNRLAALKEEQTNLIQNLREAMQGELDLVKISHLRSNVEMLAEVIENQEQEVRRLEILTEAKRHELVKARQDEEVLEILKEKAIEAFQQEMKIKESRFQDDIYIANYYQKTQKGK